jgi:glycogen(starch) synthase
VINTYNRASSLPLTLAGLRHQQYSPFEVVVVNGPSTDGTHELLQHLNDVRVVDCADVHLGRSRNIGIEAAAGELVAFIDDDAIPEPDWLEVLNAAFDDPEVGGAGGLVIDHTGYDLQYLFSLADRRGQTYFHESLPNASSVIPGTTKFAYLQGTNNCFRRNVLVDIGGFDEEIEYFLDETEVCMQAIDRGWKLVQLLGGAVHHKYLASHLRTSARVFTNPFAPVKNRTYFALRHAVRDERVADVLAFATSYVMELHAAADHLHREGVFTAAQRDFFRTQVDDGFAMGLDRGLNSTRKSRRLAPASAHAFRELRSVTPRLPRRICFVSEEYPPGACGGIGRYTNDLARELASRGHEVHVVTRSPDQVSGIDYEDAVWVHRLASPDPGLLDLDHPLRFNLLHSANVYHEVRALHERRPIDVVFSPVWNCEGFFTLFDPSLRPVVTLMTTLEKVRQLMPSLQQSEHANALVLMEDATLRFAPEVHAISRAIWVENEGRAGTPVVHHAELGVEDVPPDQRHHYRESPDFTVLFVGRLEVRKGIPTLFAAGIQLLSAHPDARIRLVGADTPNTEQASTYREELLRRLELRPDLLERFEFVGHVDDDQLLREYAAADVLCVPSLFESFGLVVLEAMRAGVPVVASDVGGMAEILLTAGQIGVPPGDAEALYTALDDLASNPSRRLELGARARRAYEEHWTLAQAADRIEEVVAEQPLLAEHCSDVHDAVVRALRPILGSSADGATSQLLDGAGFGLRTIIDRLAGAAHS